MNYCYARYDAKPKKIKIEIIDAERYILRYNGCRYNTFSFLTPIFVTLRIFILIYTNCIKDI